MATNKKNIKVRDLKPKKDAKGGGVGYAAGSTKLAGSTAAGSTAAGSSTAAGGTGKVN